MKKILLKSVDLLPWTWRKRIKNLPLVAPLQRALVEKILRGRFNHRISAGPARGVVMPLDMPRDKLFWAGTWEPEVAETVRRSCQPGFRCLDIGSYRGFFSAVMAQAGAVSVDAFEPNPANREAMQKLLELNPGLRIRFHPLAVGSQTGEIDFLLHQDGAMGKIQSSNFQTHQTSIGRLTVPMASLDDLLEQKRIPMPDFIKLDVEGAELLVLHGAKELLRKTHPVWLIECHTPTLAVQCAEFLWANGYASIRILEVDGEYMPKATSALPEICHLLARGRDMPG